MWFFVVGFCSGLLVLWWLGRFNERALARRWEGLALSHVERASQQKRAELEIQVELADVAYEQAVVLREVGSIDEAVELLDAGYDTLATFAPNLLRFLRGMSVWSRMVSAMAPVSPLRPPDFRIAQLVSLAYLNQLIHHFLLTGKERFRLRLHILSRGLQMLMRFLLHSTHKVGRSRDKVTVETEMRQINAIRGDLKTIVDKSVESYEALLTSLLADRSSIQVVWKHE